MNEGMLKMPYTKNSIGQRLWVVGYRIISVIEAIGNSTIVENPKSPHLSGFRYPTKPPESMSKTVVGNIERFSIAV
jgi:hypothetical protein